VQHADRCAANRSLPDDLDALPFEVLFPTISPWIKQPGDAPGLFIDTRKVCAFMQIAVDAGQREVLKFVSAAMGFWNYVLNMKRGQWRISLRQRAVFA